MHLILKITCPDQPGIVADLSARLSQLNCNIVESSQFCQPCSDPKAQTGEGTFFMRFVITLPKELDNDRLDAALNAFAKRFEADLSTQQAGKKLPTILMVSKFDHCLMDILYRVQTETLPLDIVAVVSNHANSRPDVERLGIPYHLLPVTKDNKAQQEAKLDEIIERTGAELVVLARYMQVLSDEFSSRHFGKIINIHHSFLPAFKGAMPYKRAWERGVKAIGATAHYVTPDLDEGPIIEQHAEKVTHSDSAKELVRRGRDIEARALSRALRLHAQGRVFIDGNRTVVFEH
ncbi:MAG: formyltetrahydrofolate deformylase [Cohaesibacter sp.]|nr:formyltetrahydrofolate deformylase [Cohaesibacter sp.]